jgi:hypothetical protein
VGELFEKSSPYNPFKTFWGKSLFNNEVRKNFIAEVFRVILVLRAKARRTYKPRGTPLKMT